MKHLFYPNLEVEHPLHIPLETLRQKNIQGLIFDLDNTIIAWDSVEMQQEMIDWLATLLNSGFKIYIVSNSMTARVKRIADQLSIPYTARAGKPLRHGFIKAMQALNLSSNQVAVIGDQVFTDVFGGNRIGAFTILVKPLGKKEFFTTKLTRVLERFIINRNI